MSSFENITERFLPFMTAHRAASAPARLMHPIRDWYVLLILSLALVVVQVSLGVFMYLSSVRGDLYEAQGAVPAKTPVLDRSTLKETLLFFEGQTTEFSELRVNPPAVPAP